MNASATDIMEAFRALTETEFAARRGAKPVVASNPGHAIDLLSAGQMGSLALVLWYDSDAPDGEDWWDTRVKAVVKAVVYQRQGLAADGQGTAALALAEELRTAISGAILDGTLDGILYQGMNPVATAEGRLLNGYTLSFGVRYARPAE
jgi:hypothetical protein